MSILNLLDQMLQSGHGAVKNAGHGGQAPAQRKVHILPFPYSLSLTFPSIGIFVPVLPTTPFLLLTAFFYARSSEKLYGMLTRNKYIGLRIEDFQKTGKLTLKTKVCSITTMWVMILASFWFFILSLVVQLILIAAGIAGTVVIGYGIPTRSDTDT